MSHWMGSNVLILCFFSLLRNVYHLQTSTRSVFGPSKFKPLSLLPSALTVPAVATQLWHSSVCTLSAVCASDSDRWHRRQTTPRQRRVWTPRGLSREHDRKASPWGGAWWLADFDWWPPQSNAVHTQHPGPSPVSHGYLRHGSGGGAWAGQYGLVGSHHGRREGRGNPHARPTGPSNTPQCLFYGLPGQLWPAGTLGLLPIKNKHPVQAQLHLLTQLHTHTHTHTHTQKHVNWLLRLQHLIRTLSLRLPTHWHIESSSTLTFIYFIYTL